MRFAPAESGHGELGDRRIVGGDGGGAGMAAVAAPVILVQRLVCNSRVGCTLLIILHRQPAIASIV